jgi:Co/Zn/Cd efflux system component
MLLESLAMSAHCCDHINSQPRARDQAYRRILWIVLAINIVMFAIELAAGLAAPSVSLQADALDFLADAGNYAISLVVLGMTLQWRARAALLKGATMGVFGLWVIGATVWYALQNTIPGAWTMSGVSIAALAANAAVVGLLWAYRQGDANMRSVWLCSRNDVVGNCAVLLAALGVFGTGTGWPDVAVAAVMASLALWGALRVIRQAIGELRMEREGAAQLNFS